MNVTIAVASGIGVAERWRQQYQHPKDGWSNTVSGSAKDKYEQLCALGRTPSVEDVDRILGNKSWTHLTCEICRDHVKRAACFHREYNEPTLVCLDCLDAGFQAFKGAATP